VYVFRHKHGHWQSLLSSCHVSPRNGTQIVRIDSSTFFFFFFFGFSDRVSLYSSGCPGTHFVDQAGLKLRNLPASASQVLGLKVCATTAWLDKSLELTITTETCVGALIYTRETQDPKRAEAASDLNENQNELLQ
jgi:hypothetical protein